MVGLAGLGLRIAKRSSMLCAIVAVARKLAGILHRMWVSETDFHVGFGAKVTQRLRLNWRLAFHAITMAAAPIINVIISKV